MKEIKFKIPIFENGKFNHFDLVEAKISETSYNFGSCGYYTTQKIEIKEPLQYTGLKDKNGKEIYEGDIITCEAVQREVNDVIDKSEKVKITYQDGYFYPFGYNAGWRSEVFDIEIIGNIYENPELLK